jgi:uncharacterized glyoxalase superfamily protein PhnB
MIKQAIPVLHITNAEASEAFYCGLLGFLREFHVPVNETSRDPCYLGVSRDGAVLHLSSHAGDGVVASVAYFLCDDVDALHAEFVSKKGTSILDRPSVKLEVWMDQSEAISKT